MSQEHSIEVAEPADESEVRAFGKVAGEALFFKGGLEDLDVWTKREGSENIRVARVRGSVAGGLICQLMGQWFGGQSIPVGAIRAVGVAPEHRAIGVASKLMRSILTELRADGVALSSLHPATQPVYRRAGYERAGVCLTYRLALRGIDVRERSLDLRVAEASDHDAIREIYSTRAKSSAGNLDRSSWMWSRIFDPPPWGKPATGFVISREGNIEGYVFCARQYGDRLGHAHSLELVDFAVLTKAAGRRMLSFLADHRSMVEHVTFRGAPADPILFLLTEQECSIARRIDWMLRLVDVPLALSQRGYPLGMAGELHLDVRDDLLAENNGRFVLKVEEGQGQVSVGGEGRLTIDVRGLAALFSGHSTPAELKTVGYADGCDLELAHAATLFAGPSPWMQDMF